MRYPTFEDFADCPEMYVQCGITPVGWIIVEDLDDLREKRAQGWTGNILTNLKREIADKLDCVRSTKLIRLLTAASSMTGVALPEERVITLKDGYQMTLVKYSDSDTEKVDGHPHYDERSPKWVVGPEFDPHEYDRPWNGRKDSVIDQVTTGEDYIQVEPGRFLTRSKYESLTKPIRSHTLCVKTSQGWQFERASSVTEPESVRKAESRRALREKAKKFDDVVWWLGAQYVKPDNEDIPELVL